jgi:hypothetical protein
MVVLSPPLQLKQSLSVISLDRNFAIFPKERIMTEVKPMTTKPDPSAATTSEKKTEISPEVEAKAKEMFESLHGHPTWEAFEGKEAYYEQVKQAAEAKTADQSASQPKK